MCEKIRYTDLKSAICDRDGEQMQGAYGRKAAQSEITFSSDQRDCGSGLARGRAGMGVFTGVSAICGFAHLLIPAVTALRCYSHRAGANSRFAGRRHHAGASISGPGALAAAGSSACQPVDAGRATQAKSTTASYVLLSYPVGSGHPAHPHFNNVPAWMIVYQQVPVTFSSQTHQDLYLFLDANTGKELLAIWA